MGGGPARAKGRTSVFDSGEKNDVALYCERVMCSGSKNPSGFAP